MQRPVAMTAVVVVGQVPKVRHPARVKKRTTMKRSRDAKIGESRGGWSESWRKVVKRARRRMSRTLRCPVKSETLEGWTAPIPQRTRKKRTLRSRICRSFWCRSRQRLRRRRNLPPEATTFRSRMNRTPRRTARIRRWRRSESSGRVAWNILRPTGKASRPRHRTGNGWTWTGRIQRRKVRHRSRRKTPKTTSSPTASCWTTFCPKSTTFCSTWTTSCRRRKASYRTTLLRKRCGRRSVKRKLQARSLRTNQRRAPARKSTAKRKPKKSRKMMRPRVRPSRT
uniref:(northern house mosquito) hypothetical protein n=1 Tax=Culex pipiens TaxID=7175 RepID=A0A8D8J5T3_CULPI